jgi:L,D-peptidoglycan transpeptidase YkuD (ErfK/YbiS/YcfS/YnhG family)
MASYYMGIKFDTVDELIEYQDKIGKLPGSIKQKDSSGTPSTIPPYFNPFINTPMPQPGSPMPHYNPNEVWCSSDIQVAINSQDSDHPLRTLLREVE